MGTPHGDRAFPRVGFFAKRDINKGEELGYLRDKNNFSMRSKMANGAKKCECGATIIYSAPPHWPLALHVLNTQDSGGMLWPVCAPVQGVGQ